MSFGFAGRILYQAKPAVTLSDTDSAQVWVMFDPDVRRVLNSTSLADLATVLPDGSPGVG